MEVLGAGLGDQGNGRAGVPAVVRRIVVGYNLDFRHRIHACSGLEQTREVRIGAHLTVHGNRVPKQARATHGRRETSELPAVRARAGRVGFRNLTPRNHRQSRHARENAEQLHDVATFHAQIADLNSGEGVGLVSTLRVDHLALGSHFDSLGHLPDRHLNAAERHALVGRQNVTYLLIRLEARFLYLDGVGSWPQGSQYELAVRHTRSRPYSTRIRVGDRDRRSGNNSARSVLNGAADFAGDHLRGRRIGKSQQHQCEAHNPWPSRISPCHKQTPLLWLAVS